MCKRHFFKDLDKLMVSFILFKKTYFLSYFLHLEVHFFPISPIFKSPSKKIGLFVFKIKKHDREALVHMCSHIGHPNLK